MQTYVGNVLKWREKKREIERREHLRKPATMDPNDILPRQGR